MVHLDAYGGTVPRPLRDKRYRDWHEMVRFFQETSHHRSFTGLDELRGKIAELENFLTQRLPTTWTRSTLS